MTLGIDVGGTFTDVARWDGRRLTVAKTSTTTDQADGVVTGATRVLADGPDPLLVHGTTVATNALLERRGARTALVTDAGMVDVVAIGRQDRPSLYDSFADRAEPLVPPSRRFALAGRARVDQSSRPAPAELAELAAMVADVAPEAVAVACLYPFLDPTREAAVAEALAGLGVPVSRSSEVANEFREFERTATTVLNAFLAPEVARYLSHLAVRAADEGLPPHVLVMRSSGGLMGLDAAMALPVAALLSGPAGGVVASAALGAALGDDRLISFDMGGTSTDVCRIEGAVPEVAYERWIGGFPVRTPAVAVHTVGAGGGSLGWVDPGGALRVGPRSAGAHPGPAAYGRGGAEPTVTDANVVLGRLPGDLTLGDAVALDADAARTALGRLGDALGLGPVAVAEGMLEVVEATMERAIRAVSVEEGADPRPARLVAFGGAGGLHATALARRLEMAGVVIPPHAGVFSAVGLLLAPPREDAARSVAIGEGDAAALDRALEEVLVEARAGLAAMGPRPAAAETVVDVRYRGQSHETPVPHRPGDGWDRLAERFHARHRERNGFARPEDPIEVVTVRAVATAPPAMTWDDLPVVEPRGPRELGARPVRIDGADREVPLVARRGLGPGERLVGPAVVVEGEATTLLGPDEVAVVHPSGALEVSW